MAAPPNGTAGSSADPAATGASFNAFGGLGALEQERQEAFSAALYLADAEADADAAALAINALIDEYSTAPPPAGVGGYVWNRDAPRVYVDRAGTSSSRQGAGAVLRIFARTGQALEDVQFCTYILLQATRRLPALGLVVSVADEDGQFLLIDAAETLDDWVSPENAEGRVWLHQGRLHIVTPLVERQARKTGYREDGSRAAAGKAAAAAQEAELDPDLDAVQPLSPALGQAIVRDPSFSTLASAATETAAFEALSGYPLTALDHTHTALAWLPHKAARVLDPGAGGAPQCIALVADALVGRDPLSARVASKMDKFLDGRPIASLPSSSRSSGDKATEAERGEKSDSTDLVLVPVKMSKRIFARFTFEHYLPPKIFGSEWQERVAAYQARIFERQQAQEEDDSSTKDEEEKARITELGPAEGSALSREELDHARWLDLGAKIACGLEMLYAESRSKGKGRQRGAALANAMQLDDAARPPANPAVLRQTESYRKLIAALQRMGFFGEELEGSKRWKELEETAFEQWRQQGNMATALPPERGAAQPDDGPALIAEKIDAVLDASRPQPASGDVSSRPHLELLRLEDDAEEAFFAAAAQRPDEGESAQDAQMSEEAAEKYAAEQLAAFSEKMDAFVGGKGDHRGARFADEDFADGDSEEDSSDDEEDDESDAEAGTDREMRDSDKVDAEARLQAKLKLESLTTEERQQAMQELVARLVPDAKEGKSGEALDQAGKSVPATSVTVQDASGQQVSSQRIEALSAEEMAALFPTPADAEPITEFGGEEDKSEGDKAAQLATEKPSTTKQAQMNEEVRKLRSTIQSRGRFDGDSDSEDSMIDGEDAGDSLEDRRNRARWLGMEQDGQEGGEDEMAFMEDEMDDFVDFARHALGLSREQYDSIIKEREARGGEQHFSSSCDTAAVLTLSLSSFRAGRISHCASAQVCQGGQEGRQSEHL